LTTPILNTGVISEFEATMTGCGNECGLQNSVYIEFNTDNSVPVFAPALFYALVITANESMAFSELVELYAIWFTTAQVPGLVMTAVPAPTTNSLVIVFPPGYNINGQSLIISFLAVASSDTVTPVLGPIVPPATVGPILSFNVTLGSELFDPVNNFYTGNVGLSGAPGSGGTQQFTNYSGFPERTTLAQRELLLLMREACGRPSALCDSDLDDMRSHIKKSCLCADLSSKCCKPAKSGKCKKSKKACLIRYFTFVSCCLNAFPCLKKRSVCDRLKRACHSCEDRHGVFCTLLPIICKYNTSVNVDLRVCIEAMFESICGYNPYCYVSKTCGGFYGLCEKDLRICRDYVCDDDRERRDHIERSEICEEKKEEEEKHHRREKKKGMFTRFRVIIIVSVTIVAVCGGIAAYSLM